MFAAGQNVRIKARVWNGREAFMVPTGYVGVILEYSTLPRGTPMYRVRLNNYRVEWFYEDELEAIDVQGK